MIYSFVAACLLLAIPFGNGAYIGSKLQGIDAGLEYQYQYEGRIMAGVGEVGGYREDVYGGRDVVDLAIRSKVRVQRASAYNIVFQMQDIEVGERKPVDSRCHGLCQEELVYTPIKSEFQQDLEKPFLLNTRQNDVEPWLLQFPSSEDQWISNIRKSVVHTFDQYLEQVVGEIQDQICVKGFEPVYPIVHKQSTHTIYGHCQAWYSIERTDQIPAMLVSDIQSPITQGSKLPSGHIISEMNHNATYKVVKSIDFDTCDDRNMPKVSRSDNGNLTHFERPNSTFAYMDRNSRSEYQVRGEVCGIFRVEKVQSESGVAVNPSSMQTQRLHTLTRQNMTLVSVSPIQSVIQLVVAYRRVDHLSYEAYSPYRAPSSGNIGEQVTWVRYNTTPSTQAVPQYMEQALLGANGVQIDYDVAIKEVKDNMQSLLQALRSPNQILEARSSSGLQTTSMGPVVLKLHAIQRIVSFLQKSQIKDLVKSFTTPTEKSLILDTLVASSSGPALEVVLELITPGQPGYDSSINQTKKASLMLQASDNIPDPRVVPQLVKFLKSLDIQKYGVSNSIALVAGTKVLRQLCSIHQEDQFSYPKELYGEEQCNVQDLVNDFIPYLRSNMMENQTSSQSWQSRVSFLQAYVTLGINVDLSSLQHVVKYDSEKLVRTTAVFGMGRRYLPLPQRDAAMKMLLTNVRSLNLTNEVRQSAVATLVSWSPDQWVWDELASISALPSSFNIAPYIISVMRSFAYGTDKGSQQSKYAHKALHKAKPVSTTTDWSHSWTGTSNDTTAQRAIQYTQAWINRNGTQVPDQTYLNIVGSANEMDERILEIIQQFENFNKTGPYIPFLFARSRNQQGEPKMKLQVKALNTDIFVPGTLSELGIHSDTPFPVLDLLLNKISPCYVKSGEEIVQYYQPKVKELFVPSEMGLPVVFKIISPSISYVKSDNVNAQCGDVSGKYSAKYDIKFANKHTTLLEVFGPFVQKKVASGVDNEKGVTLPIIISGSYNRTHSDSQFSRQGPSGNLPQNPYCSSSGPSSGRSGCNSFVMSVKSHSYQQSPIPVVFQQITPFTVKKGLRPGSELRDDDSPIKPIFEKVNFIQERLPLILPYTGVNTTLAFEGDEPSPLNWATVAKYFYNPSKVMELIAADSNKYSRLSLLVDPSTSTNTESTFSSFYETVIPDGPGVRFEHSSYSNQASYLGLGAKFSMDKNFITAINLNNVMDNSGSKLSVHQKSEVKLDSGSHVDIMRPVSYKENLVSYFTIPLPKSLEELQSQLNSNQVSNITGSIEWRRNTTSSSSSQYSPKVVAQTNISIGLSSERQNWLVQNIPEVGVQDHEEPEVSLNARAVYDEIYMLHKWNQGFSTLSQFWQRTLIRARNVAYGWNFPQFVTDLPMVLDEKAPASVFVNRTFSDTWQGYCFDCSPSWTLYDMVSRPELDMAFFSLVKGRRQINFGNASDPWPVRHGQRIHSSFRMSTPLVSGLSSELKTCLTDNSRVITYDGLSFAKLPNQCYQLLTADCAHPSSDWHVFAMSPFNAPNDRITYLRFISSDADVIVGGDSYLLINGKRVPMEQLSHSKSMITSKRSGAVIGECVQKEFAVVQCTLYHKVLLAPTRSMGRVQLLNKQQSMCGLCGNNNGIPSDDRMGNKCMYQDLRLMAASFTSNLQCGQQPALEQQIKQAERFESSSQCTTVRQLRPWGAKLPSLPYVAVPQYPTPYPQRKIEGSRRDYGPLMSYRWNNRSGATGLN